MSKVKIDGQTIEQLKYKKVFELFNKARYQETYDLAIELVDLKKEENGEIQFILGFIEEFGLINDIQIDSATLYYTKASKVGNIAAKTRLAFLHEKTEINNIYEAEKLYEEVIEYYIQNKSNEDKTLITCTAFAYSRLANIIGNNLYLEGQNPENNIKKAIKLYNEALELYAKYKDFKPEKARILNQIGNLKSIHILSQSNAAVNIAALVVEARAIFEDAKTLGLEEAKIGLLNVEALEAINPSLKGKTNIVLAKSLIKEALKINPNHLITLLNAVQIELFVPNQKKTAQTLALARKILNLYPNNQIGKNLFDTLIKQQSRFFGLELTSKLEKHIKQTINNSYGKNAGDKIKNIIEKLQEIFYPSPYQKASWLKKQTYSSAHLDKYLTEQVALLVSNVVEVLNNSVLFKKNYNPKEKKLLVKKIADNLLSDNNIVLIKAILSKKTENQPLDYQTYHHLAQIIENQLHDFYKDKEKTTDITQKLTQKEHSSITNQEEFVKLVCEKYRIARNKIEVIAVGNALPLPGKVEELKHKLNQGLIMLNVPPFSYFAGIFGGNSLLYALTSFTSDYVYNKYQQGIIGGFIEIDKLLPRGKESDELIKAIVEDIAYKYAPQLSNIADYESLKIVADRVVEKMMSQIIAETSIMKKIGQAFKNKINEGFNWLNNTNYESSPIDLQKILYTSILNTYPNSKEVKIRTLTEKNSFGDNWTADGIFQNSGVITQDRKIFGNSADILKYGCSIGDQEDIKMKKLPIVSPHELPSEIKEAIDESYEHHVKVAYLRKHAYHDNSTQFMPMLVAQDQAQNKNILKNTLVGMGAVFLIMAALFFVIPIFSVALSLIPGLLVTGSLLMIYSTFLNPNLNNHTLKDNITPDPINIIHKNHNVKLEKILDLKLVTGPTPYNENNLPTQKLYTHLITANSISSISKL